MGTLVCYGGEKDGLEVRDIPPNACPRIFYAVPNLDDEKIRRTKGNAAKRELRDKLAVLAYEFDSLISTREVFVMRRNPALDKQPNPAL
jgi:hypothetical protein